MLFWHGIPLGIDFRGGTLVYVKYSHTPDDNAVRAAMDRAGLHNARIQRLLAGRQQRMLIDLPLQETSEQALDQGKTRSSMPWKRIRPRASRISITPAL